MALRFRKTLSLGRGFKLNLGKRGAGVSWGIPGFGIGVSTDGRPFFSLGLPGTGLYWQQFLGVRK